MKTEVSVVIPVYNGESCILELYRRVSSSLEEITSYFEIIFVEDCGQDESWNQICQTATSDPKVVGIKFSRNFGQHNAITAGIDASQGVWVVVMDCDLQDLPEDIVDLYKKALEGYSVVLARRSSRKDPVLKKAFSHLFYLVLSYLSGVIHRTDLGNFGIYHRDVVDSLSQMRESTRFLPAHVKWLGFKTGFVDVDREGNTSRKSGYSLRSLLSLGFTVLFSFSNKPLHIVLAMGLGLVFSSIIFVSYILIRHFYGDIAVLGWASLIASIWFLAGVIIFILGIIGVYIGKIFDQVKMRPIYTVEGTINFDSSKTKERESNTLTR